MNEQLPYTTQRTMDTRAHTSRESEREREREREREEETMATVV